ncbi:MAG: hypothetical protein HW375_1924 [Anaerolineales bacterium]|nr:hypothetical protein [Anaerolineales bacterium]
MPHAGQGRLPKRIPVKFFGVAGIFMLGLALPFTRN